MSQAYYELKDSREFVQFVLERVETIGNHSFLRIDEDTGYLSQLPHEMTREILMLLNGFEEQHPEWEVTGWAPETRQATLRITACFFGLWIDHRPRIMPDPEKK